MPIPYRSRYRQCCAPDCGKRTTHPACYLHSAWFEAKVQETLARQQEDNR